MAEITKVDIINGAYSQMRISGLTVQPTPEDLTLALDRLEDMAEEFEARNICVNYNFEDTPDTASLTNIKRKHKTSFESCLAIRLVDFGKPIPDSLMRLATSGFSFLSSNTAQVRETQYPSRQPRGSGNSLRYNRWNRYYKEDAEAPLGSTTHTMYVNDVDDFVEHFDAYLNDGETISSYTIEADDGLTINSDSNATPDINFQILASGNAGTSSDGFLQVKIVVTTSDSRVENRFINFTLLDSDL